MASPKIIRIINDSVVRGRLSENYLTQKFIARNIREIFANYGILRHNTFIVSGVLREPHVHVM